MGRDAGTTKGQGGRARVEGHLKKIFPSYQQFFRNYHFVSIFCRYLKKRLNGGKRALGKRKTNNTYPPVEVFKDLNVFSVVQCQSMKKYVKLAKYMVLVKNFLIQEHHCQESMFSF